MPRGPVGSDKTSIHQKNDADSISSKRGMSKRARRNSSKRARQALRRDLEDELKE